MEEIGALFGDEVALDLTHLTSEQRAALDQKLLDIEVDKTTGTVEAGAMKDVQVQKEVA